MASIDQDLKHMQGSSLLGLKRKIKEVENTKSAGDLKRVKQEKKWNEGSWAV